MALQSRAGPSGVGCYLSVVPGRGCGLLEQEPLRPPTGWGPSCDGDALGVAVQLPTNETHGSQRASGIPARSGDRLFVFEAVAKMGAPLKDGGEVDSIVRRDTTLVVFGAPRRAPGPAELLGATPRRRWHLDP